ncbi:MAG: hypothetical protein KatS3mg087_0518 [Patescibacteria group bacterium]|nr:MAG: hypothetical protein KatS3mg087_0518 [Patescibacteria group bacterium]
MRTRASLRTQLKQLFEYELQTDDVVQNDTVLNEYINRAYQLVSHLSGFPVLAREANFNASSGGFLGHNWSNQIAFDVKTLDLFGLKHIYRIWFLDSAKSVWKELKPAMMMEPKYDEEFDNSTPARRVFPNPLSEIRLTFPQVKLMPADTGTPGIPNMFLFTGQSLMFDRAITGNHRIRIIGSFEPSEETTAPVRVLQTDSDTTRLPDYLDEAIVFLAGSRILLGYPDTFDVSQIWKAQAFELIQVAQNDLATAIASYSPGSVAEQISGMALGQDQKQRRRS